MKLGSRTLRGVVFRAERILRFSFAFEYITWPNGPYRRFQRPWRREHVDCDF
jgi:hypothetical protein